MTKKKLSSDEARRRGAIGLAKKYRTRWEMLRELQKYIDDKDRLDTIATWPTTSIDELLRACIKNKKHRHGR